MPRRLIIDAQEGWLMLQEGLNRQAIKSLIDLLLENRLFGEALVYQTILSAMETELHWATVFTGPAAHLGDPEYANYLDAIKTGRTLVFVDA
jgi:hypothetical protein